MKQSISFLLIVTALTVTNSVNAQGCSDAGVCTVNSSKPHLSDSLYKEWKNQIKTGLNIGKADLGITAIGYYVEYNRDLNKKLGVDIRLTGITQTGNGITTTGISDVLVSTRYKTKSDFMFTAGLKIPLHDANKKLDGYSLPMDYQPSLGTVDALAAIGYQWKSFQFLVAYQHPLTQNQNAFYPTQIADNIQLTVFQPTGTFERSADVIARISKVHYFNSRWSMTAGILPIYHIGNDKYTDLTNVEREIKGSEGLTLNTNVFVDYKIQDNAYLQLVLAAPVMVRKARPDGLTRSFLIGLEYRFRF